ncbi:MAG: divalent-cation tolerance protein CutA [Planctomycetaceae bacterium]
MELLEILAVYTTVATEDDAHRIAHEAVQRKLAACVQMEPIRSVYEWQGKIHSDPEYRLLFKTTRAAFEPLRDLICSLHSYQLPAIFAVPVVAGLPDYLHWVADCVDPHCRT